MLKYEFLHPELLYLLAIVPIMIAWYIWGAKKTNNFFKVSSLNPFASYQDPIVMARHLPFIFRFLSIAFIVVALARPRTTEVGSRTVGAEGIDIVLAMDISGSMLAEDLKPNRLEASKKVAIDFVSDRTNDRVGLVVYSGESFTQCPLTTDHAVVKNLLSEVKMGMIEDRSTAIGMGLATSVNRLKDSKATSKVIILLTDGVNNSGFVDPKTAAEIAKEFNIRTYTIGVGTEGMAPYPMEDMFGRTVYQDVEVKIDEKLMQEIADMTGGKYFRATNNKKLASIYSEIDLLEKTKLEELNYYKYEEKFFVFLLIASILFLLEWTMRYTIFRSLV